MTRHQSQRARRSGVLPTIGLIVEGQTEYAAFPLLHTQKLIAGCPPMKVINLGGVGSDLLPVGIAKRVAPKVIQHVAAGRTRVIFCLDREQRSQGASMFAADVAKALRVELTNRKQAAAAQGLAVVVADRAFEAWLLADAKGLHARKVLKSAPAFHCFEGEMGQRGFKGVEELTKLLGRPYAKTKDGPLLFEKLDFQAARAHGPGQRGSRSLQKFLKELGV